MNQHVNNGKSMLYASRTVLMVLDFRSARIDCNVEWCRYVGI